jgi:hypothetical protein
MNPEIAGLLVAAGLVLVLAGSAMVWMSTRRAERRRVRPVAQPGRLPRGWAGALFCTSVATGVILVVQWTVVAQTGSVAVWTLVLGLPAFLAGATVTRLLAVLHLVFRQRRAQATRPSGRAGR